MVSWGSRMPRSKDGTGHLRRSYISDFFRLRFTIVALVLLALFGIVLGIVFLAGHHEDEHNYIVNVLGRQRMLTQQMAKNASRIAALYEALDSPERVQPEEVLREKLVSTRASLSQAADHFERVLLQVSSGKIEYESSYISLFDLDDSRFQTNITAIRDEWSRFKRNAAVVAASEDNGVEFRKALIYVNENNERLLELSETLSKLAIANFAAEARNAQAVMTVLIACLILLGIWILFGTYRFVVQPYNVFYTGLRSLGSGEALRVPAGSKSPLMQEVNRSFVVLRDIVNLIGIINQGTSFGDTLRLIFTTFKTHIPYNYIGVATFIGYEGNSLVAAYGESDGSFAGLPRRLQDQATDIDSTSLKAILDSNQPRIINDLEAYAAAHTVKDYTRIILEEGVRSSITLPLVVNGKPLGFLFFSSREKNAYTEMHVDFLRNIRNAIALSFEKDIFVDDLVYSSTLALAKMAEARDEDTADHLDRMRRYTMLLAKCMREDGVYADLLTPEFLHSLERFSPMHDIGKVGIRDNVLLKPGRLDADEMTHMRTHTVYGANVLREAEQNIARSGRTLFKAGISIAAYHHERWDGAGYPRGLAGTKIPLEARIVAVADVLDALTTRRPYKEPFELERSFSMILEEAGKHFDPAVIGVFLANLDKFRALHAQFKTEMPENY